MRFDRREPVRSRPLLLLLVALVLAPALVADQIEPARTVDGSHLEAGRADQKAGTCLACKDGLLGPLGAILGSLFSLAAALAAGLGAGVESVLGVSGRVGSGLGRFADRIWGGLFGKFLTGLQAAFGGLRSTVRGMLALGVGGSKAAAKALEALAGWAQAVPGITAQGAEGLANVGMNAFGAAAGAARGAVETVGNVGEAAVNGVKNLLTNLYGTGG